MTTSTAFGAPRRATVTHPRTAAVVLAGFSLVGVGVGAVGFLSGAFDDLVDDVARAVPFTRSRHAPAVALCVAVGVPQAVGLALAAKNRPSAPRAAALSGALLAAWVGVQAPTLGWTAPVQPAFFGVGIAQAVNGLIWMRTPDSDRPATRAAHGAPPTSRPPG